MTEPGKPTLDRFPGLRPFLAGQAVAENRARDFAARTAAKVEQLTAPATPQQVDVATPAPAGGPGLPPTPPGDTAGPAPRRRRRHRMSRADRLLAAAGEAAQIRDHDLDPDVAALRIERVARWVGRIVWISMTMGLAFTASNVAMFAGGNSRPWSIGWINAWLLDPMVSLMLLAVLIVEGLTARYRVRTDWRLTVAKLGLLGAAYVMNTWQAWTARDVHLVVLHSIPPVLVFLTAELWPYLRELLARCVAAAHELAVERAEQERQRAAATAEEPVEQPAPAAPARKRKPTAPAAPASGTGTASATASKTASGGASGNASASTASGASGASASGTGSGAHRTPKRTPDKPPLRIGAPDEEMAQAIATWVHDWMRKKGDVPGQKSAMNQLRECGYGVGPKRAGVIAELASRIDLTA